MTDHTNSTKGVLSMYRAPEGRPVSWPPLSDFAASSDAPATPAQRGAIGALAFKAKLDADPQFAARFRRNVSAAMVESHRRRRAKTAMPDGNKRWYGYAELATLTGLSYMTVYARAAAAKWPVRKLPSGRAQVFGDPATIPAKPSKRQKRPAVKAALPSHSLAGSGHLIAQGQETKPTPTSASPQPPCATVAIPEWVSTCIELPPAPRSLWSRLFGWMFGR